jgi:hypothetical protein
MTAAFGLHLDGLTLPWLPPGDGAGLRRVPYSVSPAVSSRDCLVESSDSLVVGWPDYAEFTCTSLQVDVRAVVIDATEAALATLLSVLPLALPIYDLEPLHGCALAVPGGALGALCVLGHSGAGKSSTAAALVRAGLDLLAEDACAVGADGLLRPGPPLLALRSGADVPVATYNRKQVVLAGPVDPRPRPVVAAVVLDRGDRLAVTEVTRGAAFAAVLGLVRAPDVLRSRRRATQLAAVAAVAAARVAVVTYDPAAHDPDTVAATILGWLHPQL